MQTFPLIQLLNNSEGVNFTQFERKLEIQHWFFRKAIPSSNRWSEYFNKQKALTVEKVKKSKKNTEIRGTRVVSHTPYFSDAAVMTIG